MSVATRNPGSIVKVGRTTLQDRVRLTYVIIAVLNLGLIGRLVDLQIIQHVHFIKQANQIRLRTISLPALRGDIVDRNGQPLAISIPVADVIADPTEICSPQQTAQLIASSYNQDPPDVAQLSDLICQAQKVKLKSGKPLRYLKLASSLSYSQVTAIEAIADKQADSHRQDPTHWPDYMTGITVKWHLIRDYPNGDIAAQILGFPSEDPDGKFDAKCGVEASQNAVLAGSDGYLKTEVDDAQRPIPGTIRQQVQPSNGQALTLTIDLHIQEISQVALNESVTEHHAQSGSVVVLDPKTGEILAMASDPIFDPNNATKAGYVSLDNRPVSDLYEPGSTLKTLTLAAVLDKMGLQMADYRVVCTGKRKVGKYIIHCAQDPPNYGVHGNEDMQDVLRNSCNIGASIYAEKLGAESLYSYMQRFGLFDRPDCGLPSAKHSRLKSPEVKHWPQIELDDISFGQGVSLTALQLASIYATIANNGVRVFPHIVLGAKPPAQPYQVIKPEVAAKMLSMLRAVVTDGTGKPAQVANYTVGGKTGSAQVAEHGHYGDEYIGSFCGIAPLSDPRLVVLCVINKPVGFHWGAVVAAPVVRTILQQSLWYLKVHPDAPGQLAYVDPSAAKSTQIAEKPTHPQIGRG